MSELRLGDVVDDYCIKCRRLTNHSIVSMVEGDVAKVRCRSCYHDHNYLHEQIPPSKKDLKKQELLNAAAAEGSAAPEGAAPEGEAAIEAEAETVESPAGAESAAGKKRARAKKS